MKKTWVKKKTILSLNLLCNKSNIFHQLTFFYSKSRYTCRQSCAHSSLWQMNTHLISMSIISKHWVQVAYPYQEPLRKIEQGQGDLEMHAHTREPYEHLWSTEPHTTYPYEEYLRKVDPADLEIDEIRITPFCWWGRHLLPIWAHPKKSL